MKCTWLLLAVLPACNPIEGLGSNIPPELPREPEEGFRVLVADDAGNPVAVASAATGERSAISNGSGRATILGTVGQDQLLIVDGSSGSATDTDRLGTLVLRTPISFDNELAEVVYLPDTHASRVLTMPPGVLPIDGLLDDRSNSGGQIGIAAGTTVGLAGASRIDLRLGRLTAEHLPTGLPSVGQGAVLPSRGIYLDPPAVTFTPPAALAIPNDLRIPVDAYVRVVRLDSNQGRWIDVGSASVTPDGLTLVGLGVVSGGGLYAFMTVVAPTTQVSGRVLNVLARPVSGALVRLGEATARTRSDGSYFLDPIASVDGVGSPRALQLELHGGYRLRPSSARYPVTTTASAVDLGDRFLETLPVSDLWLQYIDRGRAVPGVRIRASSVTGLSYAIGNGDDQGIVRFEEQDTGELGEYISSSTTLPRAEQVVSAGAGLFVLERGRRYTARQMFTQEQAWWTGRSSNGITRTEVHDNLGTGLVRGAFIVRGSVPGEGLVGETLEFGHYNTGYGIAGEATAVITTGADGKSVTSACTFVDIDTNRVEIPVERARRRRLGNFDRHGLLTGSTTLPPITISEVEIRGARRGTLQDWFDSLHGLAVDSLVPRKEVSVAANIASYRIGVPTPLANVVALARRTDTPLPRIVAAGLRGNQRVIEGGTVAQNVPMDALTDSVLRVPNALAGLDPRLRSQLTADWAVKDSAGFVIDMARGIAGNLDAVGDELRLSLPSLVGGLAGAQHVIALRANAVDGPRRIRQWSLLSIEANEQVAAPMLTVPSILSPAPGELVSANEFKVQFTVPPGTLYTLVRLRNSQATETREWLAVVPNNLDRFNFRALPESLTSPLKQGLIYDLEVTAVRVGNGPVSRTQRGYQYTLSNYVGLGAVERGVDATASTTISISL